VLNDTVHQAGGAVDDVSAKTVREQYRELLKQAEIECPPSDENNTLENVAESNAVKPEICWSD